jgi:hypothetical protein
MHIVHFAYCAYSTYLFAYCMLMPPGYAQGYVRGYAPGNTYHAYFLTYNAYYFTYLLTYLASWINDILCIFCIFINIFFLIICMLCLVLHTMHSMHSMHTMRSFAYCGYRFILVIFYIFCIFCVQVSFQCLSLFIPIVAWSPIQGPSCSRTTTYIHRNCSGFCHKKLQESPLILFACQTVSSLFHQLEQVEDVPVWS